MRGILGEEEERRHGDPGFADGGNREQVDDLLFGGTIRIPDDLELGFADFFRGGRGNVNVDVVLATEESIDGLLGDMHAGRHVVERELGPVDVEFLDKRVRDIRP